MLPVIFRFGSFTLYTYGFFLGLAVFIGVFLFWRQAREEGFDKEKLLDLALISLLAGFLSYKILAPFFLKFGGFLGSGFGLGTAAVGFLAAACVFLRKTGWSVLKIGDAAILPLSLSFGLFRLGAFLGTGAGFGNITAAASYFSLSFCLYRLGRRRLKTGFVFLLGALAFLVIALTVSAVTAGFFNFDQIILLALLLFSVLKLKSKGYFKEELMAMRITFPYGEKFLAQLKKKLLRQKEEIEAAERKVEGSDPFLRAGRTEANAEFMDEADEEIGHSLTQSTLLSLAEVKNQVLKALARFKRGRYGFCEKCKKPIDKARLKALPAATQCFKCEQKLESDAS